MLAKALYLMFCALIYLANNVNCDGYYDVKNWKYHFPSGSGMGIYAALALPVPDSVNIDLFYAVFFEAYYLLPYDEISLEYPPLVSDRAFGRRSLYDSLEAKLDSKGYPGKSCLLKSICETASYTTLHVNGLVGDLVHLLFTPSSTKHHDESYFAEYIEAEENGRKTQDCQKYNYCGISLLDFMSFIK